MLTKHKAQLEEVMDKFISKIVEDCEYDGCIYDGMVEDMANSASLVFDSSMKSQVFAKEQGS